MDVEMVGLILATLLAHVLVAYGSIMYIVRKKSGELRNYIESPELKSKMVSWFTQLLNEDIDYQGQKGKLVDLAGDMVLDKSLGYLQSEDGQKLMAGVLDSAASVVTQRVQEWLGGHVGQVMKDVKGIESEGIAALAGEVHPLLGKALSTKAGKKLMKEPLVREAIPIVAEYIQRRFAQPQQPGNGGVASGGGWGTNGGTMGW